MRIEWQGGFLLSGNKIQNAFLLTLDDCMIEAEDILKDCKSGNDKKSEKDDSDNSSNSDGSKKKGRPKGKRSIDWSTSKFSKKPRAKN